MWVLIGASELNEILYFAFTVVGIEPKAVLTMDFQHGVRHLTSAVNPWSHGLCMSLVWAALAAAVAFAWFRNRRAGAVIGLVVFSHWGLDFLMHSNLPLFLDGSPQIGLGLENTGPGFIFMTVFDLALVATALVMYLRNRRIAAVSAKVSPYRSNSKEGNK
jgi:membrane-bound metal-dependent hydrolase YbcI (DUF457 family)